MEDDLDERLRRRLSALDAAVPTAETHTLGISHRGRRVGVATRLPLGFAVGLVVVLLGVAVVGASLRQSPNAAAPPASSQSQSPSATVTPQPSPAAGMIIRDAQALPIPGSGNPVIVVATVTNGTGQDDKLLGGSSPVAATGNLYATSGASSTGELIPSDETGMANLAPMQWWLIRANETIRLRAGASKIVLNGLARPLSAGETVEVTFKFASAPPVTVTIPVVAALADG